MKAAFKTTFFAGNAGEAARVPKVFECCLKKVDVPIFPVKPLDPVTAA